jgi:hypothetical protein
VLPDQRLSHFLARRALADRAVKSVNAVDYLVIALYMALMLASASTPRASTAARPTTSRAATASPGWWPASARS